MENISDASEEELKPVKILDLPSWPLQGVVNQLLYNYKVNKEKLMEKTSDANASEEDVQPATLLDTVLSWPLQDVLNENLYKYKVHMVPETFKSATDYKNSFTPLLFEETRADLFSSLYAVSRAPICEIENVVESRKLTLPIFKAQNQFIRFQHVIRLKNIGNYKPVSGDIIAFTHIRPRHLNDLNTLESPYRIAYVKEAKKAQTGLPDSISVLTSICMKMDIEYDSCNNKELSSESRKMDVGYNLWNNRGLKLYAVYLMNMTTNLRIWDALKSISDAKILKTVLGPRQITRENCELCLSDSEPDSPSSFMKKRSQIIIV